MTKLLRANFTRMFKDKVFWVCIITAFCTGLVTSIVAAASEPSWLIKWGPKIIQRFKEVPFFASVFASLFLGTEYSNGTLRNKLMIGSARADIYFSSLITVAAGGLLIMAAELLAPAVFGIFMFALSGVPREPFWGNAAMCVSTIISFCSLLTLFGMICAKKAVTVTASIGVMIICYITAPALAERLNDTTGFYDGYVHAALTAVDRILPFGTLERAGKDPYNEITNDVAMYSFGTIAVSTAVGVVLFRKKDLK